jgi:hypothetical protein
MSEEIPYLLGRLAAAEAERDALAKKLVTAERARRQPAFDPRAKKSSSLYSDIVSDGGMDPRNTYRQPAPALPPDAVAAVRQALVVLERGRAHAAVLCGSDSAVDDAIDALRAVLDGESKQC